MKRARSILLVTLAASTLVGCELLLNLDGYPGAAFSSDAGSSGDGGREPVEAASDADGDRGADVDVPGTPSWRYVFVTSGTRTADMGRLLDNGDTPQLAADRWCASLAAAHSNLASRHWAAWLSGALPATSAGRRLPTGSAALEYRRIDGQTVFAAGFPSVVQFPLQPIVLDEGGKIVDAYVWTQTQPSGETTGDTTACDGYLSGTDAGAQQGYIGYTFTTSAGWTRGTLQSCDVPARLYCFEVP